MISSQSVVWHYLVYYGLPGAAIGATSILALYLAAYRYVHKFRNIFKQMGMPYVEPKPWLGSWGLYLGGEDFFTIEKRLIQENGPVFGFFEGRQPCVMVSDPDLIRQVLLKDFDSFVDRRIAGAIRSRPIDFALISLTGQRWKHVRQQVTPAFTPAALKRMTPLIVATARQLVANVDRKATANEDLDIKNYCSAFTLDVIASVAFGMELNSLENPNSEFVTSAKEVFGIDITKGAIRYIVTMMLMFPFTVKWLAFLTPKNAKIMKPFTFFQSVIEQEMKRRQDGAIERPDFLQMIMHLQKDPNDPKFKDQLEFDEYGLPWLRNGLTTDEIVGQSLLFFLAGYETTANNLALILFALASNPDCQSKVYEEIRSVLPVGSDGKLELTMESVSELKYMEMCINETMRVYCPLTRLERTCTKDTQLGGYSIQEGTVILVPVNAMHNDPAIWPEPERFDPERFSSMDSVSPLDYMPFGLGNRNCIGMRLAMLEMKMVLASLLREFEFSLSPSVKLPMKWKANAQRSADPPIQLRASRRN